MGDNSLEGGFISAPQQSAQAFRKIMNAMARPGIIENLAIAKPPSPLSSAAGTVLLTLCDSQTSIYLAGDCDCRQVQDWITFHCNAPLTDPLNCTFAVGAWDQIKPLDRYAIGTPEYPDRSATLIVECDELLNEGHVLKGPGIKDQHQLSLPETDAFKANALLFPLGLDFYFTCKEKIAALPRTTKIIDQRESA